MVLINVERSIWRRYSNQIARDLKLWIKEYPQLETYDIQFVEDTRTYSVHDEPAVENIIDQFVSQINSYDEPEFEKD